MADDCPRCGRTRVTTAVSREATAGTVAALAESLPVRRCPEGHEPGRVEQRWRDAVARAVDDQLLTADRRWLRADTCGRCGAALRMPARRTRHSVTAVFPDGADPSTITFDLPRTRCTECAADLVPAGAAGDLDDALAALWEG